MKETKYKADVKVLGWLLNWLHLRIKATLLFIGHCAKTKGSYDFFAVDIVICFPNLYIKITKTTLSLRIDLAQKLNIPQCASRQEHLLRLNRTIKAICEEL